MPVTERTSVAGAKKPKKIVRLALDAIEQNPYQPRRVFAEELLWDLAESINTYGLLSPLIVRPAERGGYELIAGERRYRALRLLNYTHCEAYILPVEDRESAMIALVENLHRKELTYFEEAEAYQMMIRAHGCSQEELGKALGRSQSMIANRLRLLKLPGSVRDEALKLGLSERHARALLKLTDIDHQRRAVKKAAEDRMSVRQFEAYIMKLNRPPAPRRAIKTFIRDHRLFVNAVMDTVKQINASGIRATGRVVETEDRIEVVVTMNKAVAPARLR